MPTCGAVIQPIAVSVVSTASPLAAAAQAAMPPVTTSGRAGCVLAPPASSGPDGPDDGGAWAETLTKPILATIASRRQEARRAD